MTSSQPAHLTKHISLLLCPFNASAFTLAQHADGVSNGTALWLGGQCLSIYLADTHSKFSPTGAPRRPRAVELGSGIGLSALALCSLGWDVLATDIPHVISSVLTQNISNNLSALPTGSGTIQIRELDWTVPPENWKWDHELAVASHSDLSSAAHSSDLLQPPFDLIISADTVYSPELVQPMLRTLYALSSLSATSSGTRPPHILLCVERRDSSLVDGLLADAKENWKFSVERIPHKKLVKSIQKASQWDKSDWEGIELWKFRANL